MELLNPGLELFGAQGVDFSDDTESLFSERLPRVLDCELSKEISSLLDIQQNWDQRPPSDAGTENDSVFSDDSFKSESEHDMRTGMDRLAGLPSEDDMLCSDPLNLNSERADVEGGSEVFLELELQLSKNAKDSGGSPGPDQGYASQEEVIEVGHHQEEGFLVGDNQEGASSQGELMCGKVDPPPNSSAEVLKERRDSLSEDLHSRLFADLNFADMLSVGREELEEVDRVSNLISGAECDFSEELGSSSGSATGAGPPTPLTNPLLESQELDLKEEELDCDLGQFNFNLALTDSSREKELADKLAEDLQRITEELTSVSPSSLWAECFPEGTSECDDDFFTSLLSSPDDNLDPEYFNSDYFDIDSVDPTCIHQVKEESPCEDEEEEAAKVEVGFKVKEEIKEEEEDEEEEVHSSRLDHDYSLPPSSSLLITPPHSSEDESESEDKFKVRSHLTKGPTTHKLVKTHQQRSTGATQIIKFQHKKDLKFVMSFQVKSEELKSTSPRSLLKSKLVGREGRRVKELQREEERRSSSSLHSSSSNSPQKTAKELVREIIEKRSRMDLKTKREHVKSMKRKLRLEGKTEDRGAKHRCLTDLRSKPDLKKYRKFEEERELHNSMERQRRVELKDAYDSLKERIPTIATEDKVSKLMILNTASDFCRGMEGTLSKLRRERQREVERSRKLRQHLASLQVRLP